MRSKLNTLALLICTLVLSTSAFAQDKIYWSETIPMGMGSVSTIRLANLDGSSPQSLPGNPIFSPIVDLAVDSLNSKLYRIDSGGDRIVRSNLDGSADEVIQSGLVSATGLALDPARQQIYWTNRINGAISRCSYIPLSSIQIVTPSGASDSVAIDLDLRARKIYWTQRTGKVQRMSYDGGAIELVDDYPGLKTAPFGISLDPVLQRAFYTLPISASLSLIAFRDLNLLTAPDGFEVAADSFSNNHLVVDPHPGGRIYWTHTGVGAVSSSSKTGDGPAVLIPGNPARGIDLFLSCDAFSSDSDGDGTPDCAESCDLDSNKTSPGSCGCGLLELDTDADGVLDCTDLCPSDANKSEPGLCGCGEFDNLRTATELTCDDAPLLDENTRLNEGPQVFVSFDAEGNPVVRIVFARFAAARSIRLLKRRNRATSALKMVLPATNNKLKKLSVRYDARLRVEGAARDYARYTVKRNELTIRNLKPGSYSVRYRALGTRDGKSVIRSNFSPKSFFTIP